MHTPHFSIPSLLKTSLLALAFTLSSCTSPDESANQENSKSNTSIAASKNDANSTVLKIGKGAPPANQGIVRTVHQAGGYSYIETEIKGSSFWIATAISTIKPGDEIAWKDYAIMNSFKSKALNRTFDQVLFVDKIQSATVKASSNQNAGTVLESIESAGYTYIQVKTPSENVWIAAPVTKVTVGQSISWNGGATMQKFSSRSLGRTFDKIIFVGSVQASQG